MNITPYVKSGYPVLYIVTPEESRAEKVIYDAAVECKRKLKVWSHTEGLSTHDGKETEEMPDPVDVLNRIKGEPAGTIIVLRDFHMFLTIPKTIRLVRDMARDFKQQKKTVIITAPYKKIPPELERDVTVLEFELPSREEVESTLTTLVNTSKAETKTGKITPDERERIVQAAMGLTQIEAENAFAKAIIEFASTPEADRKEPISKLVMKEKANCVKKTGILEYFEAKTGADDIGGLENLKEWLTTRSKAFSKSARDFGLPMPRGILLVGLPGCGKSLSAKAASNILGVPLLRFDIGKVFGGLVGESERNMRTAIQTAEAVGNCVLWIDEMEKAFAGMGSGGSTDGGTSQRVFGNFITWMQEKTTPCFIISTVNRIESLPPELLRKGRFDETFFVGLPSEVERNKIIRIHVNKYGKKLATFTDSDIDKCVKLSKGFSGAEIEEAVVTALYTAFHHSRALKVEDLQKALQTTNPLSISKAKELEQMASWAKSNAINASREDKQEKEVVSAGRQLDI